MKFIEKTTPRKFEVGYDKKTVIKDCGVMQLSSDEQITFMTESGMEYDVTRKAWGFYATPSINGRLLDFNLRTVLVKNKMNRFFIMLVEQGHEKLFQQYVDEESLIIISWLSDADTLRTIEQNISEDLI